MNDLRLTALYRVYRLSATMVEIVGAAAPAFTPIAKALQLNKIGKLP